MEVPLKRESSSCHRSSADTGWRAVEGLELLLGRAARVKTGANVACRFDSYCFHADVAQLVERFVANEEVL